MGGAGFPPCWLFFLWQPNTGAYLGSLVGLMADSRKAHAKEYFPELLLSVSLSPRWATATPWLCRRPSNTIREVWFTLPWGHCSFPCLQMHTLLCVCPPRVESLFPPVLSKSCNQFPLGFKVWFSMNSSSRCWTPRLGSLTWGSEPSLQWVDFCGISVLQSVSHPPSSYGIWFYCDCAPHPSPCGFSFIFGCGVSFLVSSSVFLSMIVQQLAVILVFSQEGVRARPSTLPSWFRHPQLSFTTSPRNLSHCESLVFHLLGYFQDIQPFLLDHWRKQQVSGFCFPLF